MIGSEKGDAPSSVKCRYDNSSVHPKGAIYYSLHDLTMERRLIPQAEQIISARPNLPHRTLNGTQHAVAKFAIVNALHFKPNEGIPHFVGPVSNHNYHLLQTLLEDTCNSTDGRFVTNGQELLKLPMREERPAANTIPTISSRFLISPECSSLRKTCQRDQLPNPFPASIPLAQAH